jgi:hypothetical protein
MAKSGVSDDMAKLGSFRRRGPKSGAHVGSRSVVGVVTHAMFCPCQQMFLVENCAAVAVIRSLGFIETDTAELVLAIAVSIRSALR